MRYTRLGLTLCVIGGLFLGGCGGGGSGSGSSSSSSGGPSNVAPVANAGTAQTVTAGNTVNLDGAGSSDPDGSVASYVWSQTAGTAVALSSTTAARPTFAAPSVATATVLTFSLTITDNQGATSPASTVNITVNPAAATVNFTGQVRFARVKFNSTSPRGLNYANPVLGPARGVTVRALDAGTQTVRAAGTTDANGEFSFTLPGDLSIDIEVEARMQRTGGPSWDVRVQDAASGTSPYKYRHGTSFNSSVGTRQSIDIPTGIDAAGTATGTRASGPFAVLDTIYTAIQGVLGAEPAASFPALIVHWGPSQTQGTFFSSAPAQRIALLSDLSEDTDEFDQHVVAHEFGHYIEFNFSRSDNIGGAHSIGERLDPRVAFGEGFGYAFAAMMLNDTDARDSFVGDITPNDGVDNPVSASSGFNIETNPTGTSGCWCSETSVWAVLYDLYDSAADGNDTLALGFQPIWNVLKGPQRSTPAFTTLFSFITALKAAQPASATAIDTLVAAQNIDSAGMDAFATGEGHSPSTVPVATALPVFTTAGIPAGPIVLASTDNAGRNNKLGNHRFIRWDVTSPGRVTISATSSNANTPDVDFLLFRNGIEQFSPLQPPKNGTDPPTENPEEGVFDVTPGTYIIDVYDCANGCLTEEGTPGDYTLTVTIN